MFVYLILINIYSKTHSIHLYLWYSWNIVESDAKHHNLLPPDKGNILGRYKTIRNNTIRILDKHYQWYKDKKKKKKKNNNKLKPPQTSVMLYTPASKREPWSLSILVKGILRDKEENQQCSASIDDTFSVIFICKVVA